MYDHLNIEINIDYGNAACQQWGDIRSEVIDKLSDISGDNQQLSLRDLNGNPVGSISIKANES